jgi:hypothetical protein
MLGYISFIGYSLGKITFVRVRLGEVGSGYVCVS